MRRFALTNRALYRLLGTDEPFVFVEVLGAPGTRYTGSVAATDRGIVYDGNDTLRLFDGNESLPLDGDALSPLFRSTIVTDGVAGIVPVCSTFARSEYVISDGDNTTLAYSPDGGWRNIGVPCRAFFWEKDTRVLLAAPNIAATTRIASFEGDSNGEQAGIVGELIQDVGGALVSDFEVETGGPDNNPAYKGAGVWGTCQRIYILGQTENQTVAVSLVIDN